MKTITTSNNQYAMLPDRVKAAVIDSILLIAAMYGVSEILGLFENVPDYVKMVLAAMLFLLYDPFFTSRFGGTIGHSYSKIMVKKESDTSQNIVFFPAVLRFVLKFFLGWISLLTVTGTEKKKAIHDFAANSVVLVE